MSAILMAAAMAVSAPGTPPAHVQAPPPPPDPAPAHVETPPPPPDPAQATVHTVAPGESLSRIAQCELGHADRWVEIYELNRNLVTNPNVIVAGWALALPEPGAGDCPPVPVPSRTVAASSVTTSSSSGSGSSTASSRAASSNRAASSATPRKAKSQPAQSSAGGNLGSIRQCESGGDYGAVSSSGKYRGAYQFDQQTWESVGGSGDPAAASPTEQDQRAAALKQQRGSSPWPNCG